MRGLKLWLNYWPPFCRGCLYLPGAAGSIHLHVLLNLPNDETLTEGQLASIWLSVLNELGDYYHINMFSNYDKPDYSPNDPHILAHTANLKKFHLSQNPNYQHTYLGKKVSKTPRPLTIANNKPVAFVRWGGVSDSLKPHVQALSLKERIPVDCKDQVFEDIETAKALIESVASVNWKDHILIAIWENGRAAARSASGYT